MKTKTNLQSWAVLLTGIVICSALVSGCASYRLGSMLPPEIKTVYVPTFVNRSGEPLLEVQTTSATINEIQRDGSLRIAEEAQADSIITVQLISSEMQPIPYNETRKTAAENYRAVITASFVLTDNRSGKVLAQTGKVIGEALFPVTGDLSSSKRRILPDVSEDLAHAIVGRMVEAW